MARAELGRWRSGARVGHRRPPLPDLILHVGARDLTVEGLKTAGNITGVDLRRPSVGPMPLPRGRG